MALLAVGAISAVTAASYVLHIHRERNLFQHVHKDVSMKDRVVIVTGANSGMGLETSSNLLRYGATVVVVCRALSKAQSTANELEALGLPGKAVPMEMELGSLDSVRKFCEEFKSRFDKLHVLVQNAGIMNTPYVVTKVWVGRAAGGDLRHALHC